MSSGALILAEMWRKPDFRRLPRTAQCLYVQLCSNRDLDSAGVLTLNVVQLAKACDEIDGDDIVADLQVLEDARFVFVDYDTDEVFVRARMRVLQVAKSPNYLTSALRSAMAVESMKLREVVAAELRRLGHVRADEAAAVLMGSETLPKPFPNPPTPPPTQSHTQGGAPKKRPTCSRHPENHDGPCRACQRRREWDEAHNEALATSELGRRRALREARAACPHCDENGMVETAAGVARCTAHREAVL
ncbi:hypothetical protein SEA_GODPHATHER_57 [Mycobacterium phage GodPhather]|nr:hypothetical protein SEA_GODPHATHER_57 [Mycobacterium phage GodPhather]